MAPRAEEISIFELILGQDTYSSQDASRPNSARRLQSLIPSISGVLTRETGLVKYLPTQLGAPSSVGSLFQYNYNDASGVRQNKQFAATATQLFMEVAGAWVAQSLINPATGLATTSPFADYPYFVVVNNLLHIGDGTNNWIYDGPNAAFVVEGFPAPTTKIGITSTASAGNITAAVGRYYWFTFADETAGRVHESSSSPISASTGPLTAKQVQLSLSPDTIGTTIGSPTVVSAGAAFTSDMVGLALHIGPPFSGFYGILSAFVNSSTMTLDRNAFANNGGASYIVVPPRTTAIHLYCSETDGSKLGKFLLSSGLNTMGITDNSPFINQANSAILDIDRPFRNDPPPGSRMMELHKYRIFRVRNTQPNFFLYTANEEVAAGDNGSPQESTPGASATTQSDIVNELSYPRQSLRIRALCSHGDALYVATEKETIPLYGQSFDDFGLSQVISISKGAAGRWAMKSTSHGLVMLTYDRKLLLMPNSPYANYTATTENVTEQLQEIGFKLRKELKTIKASDLDNVRLIEYSFMDRNWLVLTFQDNNSAYHTWIYDFDTKGWFELQRGYVSLGLFEVSAGNIILVGGGSDGFVYVIDDQTGTFSPNNTCPTATFNTALIDFGKPGSLRMPEYVEMEVSNASMADSITLNFYLDPPDVDNLDTNTSRTVDWSLVDGETNIFRAWFNKPGSGGNGAQGTLCKRMLLNFAVASDTNTGSIRGLTLTAIPASPLAL